MYHVLFSGDVLFSGEFFVSSVRPETGGWGVQKSTCIFCSFQESSTERQHGGHQLSFSKIASTDSKECFRFSWAGTMVMTTFGTCRRCWEESNTQAMRHVQQLHRGDCCKKHLLFCCSVCSSLTAMGLLVLVLPVLSPAVFFWPSGHSLSLPLCCPQPSSPMPRPQKPCMGRSRKGIGAPDRNKTLPRMVWFSTCRRAGGRRTNQQQMRGIYAYSLTQQRQQTALCTALQVWSQQYWRGGPVVYN